MKEREFMRAIKTLSSPVGKGKRKRLVLDADKIKVADPELLSTMVSFLVRKRQPIVLDFVDHGNVDKHWLSSCAYFYEVQGTFFKFLCTSENKSYIA